MIVAAIAIVALVMLFLGFEMFIVLGLPGILTKEFFYHTMPNLIYGQRIVGGINVSTLLAIPFFIFAAEIMSKGSIARYLTQMVGAFLGHRRGGMGLTTVATAAAFGSVSGSAPATVAALGANDVPDTVAGFGLLLMFAAGSAMACTHRNQG